MEEEFMKFKQNQIDTIAKELRTHYVYNEFFVDPNKNFLKKLEKIKNYEKERELYSNCNNIIPTDSTESIKTKSSDVSPKILYDDGITVPLHNTSIHSSEFKIDENKTVTVPSEKTINYNDFQKLKDDYFSLLEEKKFLESQVEKLDHTLKENYDLKFQLQNLKDKFKELDEKLTAVTEERKSLNERCTKVSNENYEMLGELNKLRESLNYLEREKNNSKSKMNSVNNKIKLNEKEINNLKKKIHTLTHENKNLKEKIEDELFAKNNIEKKYIDKLSYFETYISELKNSKFSKENIILSLRNLNDNEEFSKLLDFKFIEEQNMVEIYFENVKVTEIISKNFSPKIKPVNISPRNFFLDLSKIKLLNNDTQYLPRKRNSHREKTVEKKTSITNARYTSYVPFRDVTNFNEIDKSPVKQCLSLRSPQKKPMTENKENYRPFYAKIFSVSSKKSSNSNSGRSKFYNPFNTDYKPSPSIQSSEFVIDPKVISFRQNNDIFNNNKSSDKVPKLTEMVDSSPDSEALDNVNESLNPPPPKQQEFNKFRYIFSSQPIRKKAICLDEILSNEPSPQQVVKNINFSKNIIEEEVTINQFDTEEDVPKSSSRSKNNIFIVQTVENIDVISPNASQLMKFNNLSVSKANDSFIANDHENVKQSYLKVNESRNYSINISNNNIWTSASMRIIRRKEMKLG